MTVFWLIVLAFVVVLGFGSFLLFTNFGNEESRLVNRAEDHLDSGSTGDAKQKLRQALQINPDNDRARWELAKVLQRTGEYEEASEHLEHCLNHGLFPEGVRVNDALVRLAQIYEKGGFVDEAIDTWSRYLEQNPDSMEAHFRRGRLYFREREIDRALQDFRSIEDNFEDVPDLLSLYLGRCLYRKERYEDAYDYYQEYLSTTPENTEAEMEMASLARKLDRPEEARSLFESIAEKGTLKQEAEALVSLTSMAREEGALEETKKYLDRLDGLKENRGLPETLDLHRRYQRAKLLEVEDHDDEALDEYRSIYEKRKNFLDVEAIINERVEQLDPRDLLDDYMNADRATFVRMAEEIVNLMNFEVISSDSFGPDEVNVTAREEANDPSVNRILFTFKRWDNNVGEWPLREFELQILEKKFDRGIFVAPGGFQYSAKKYVEKSPIRLIGPDTLLQYLKEVEKKDL